MLVHHFVMFRANVGRGVTDKISTREDISACVFISTQKDSVVEAL